MTEAARTEMRSRARIRSGLASFPALRCGLRMREFRPSSAEHEQQTLARLADGSLDEGDRGAVEAYVAGSPDAQVRLARQRRVTSALRAGGPVLSSEAHAELDALIGRRDQARPRLRVRPALGIAVLAAAVVVAALAVLLLSGGNGVAAPSITKTALLAYSPPTASAPRVDQAHPKLLRATFVGITLPNYESQFGVRVTGQRSDELGGRKLLTVYYRLRNGEPMSYSIVSGTPLATPHQATLVKFRGVQIRGYSDHGLGIVTLVRKGHTCVLAGKTGVGTLVALAEAPLRSE